MNGSTHTEHSIVFINTCRPEYSIIDNSLWYKVIKISLSTLYLSNYYNYIPTLNLMFVLGCTYCNTQAMTLIYFITLLIRRGHLDIVKLLVNEAHCKADAVDNNGKTPLHLAAE